LSNSIDELSLGLYGESRICRELIILKKIAQKHGLERYFSKRIINSKRNQQNQLFDGNGISPKVLYIDAKPYGIKNIYDAAYSAKNIYTTYSVITIKNIIIMLIRSLKYRLNSKKKGKCFPLEAEWERINNA
jgi:hypothetical protein